MAGAEDVFQWGDGEFCRHGAGGEGARMTYTALQYRHKTRQFVAVAVVEFRSVRAQLCG